MSASIKNTTEWLGYFQLRKLDSKQAKYMKANKQEIKGANCTKDVYGEARKQPSKVKESKQVRQKKARSGKPAKQASNPQKYLHATKQFGKHFA